LQQPYLFAQIQIGISNPANAFLKGIAPNPQFFIGDGASLSPNKVVDKYQIQKQGNGKNDVAAEHGLLQQSG
jgi:hypothetical protein